MFCRLPSSHYLILHFFSLCHLWGSFVRSGVTFTFVETQYAFWVAALLIRVAMGHHVLIPVCDTLSFDASQYTKILPQACMESEAMRNWYACNLTIPFLGCCSSNLCGPTGWPNDDLRASRLSENSSNAEVFVSDSDYFSISSSPSALSTSTSATETLELPTSEARHRDRIPLGTWIPIGVKSLVFLIACALFLMMARKKHWFSRKGAVLQKNDTRPSSASDINNGGASQSASRDSAITRWATSRASHTNRSPMPFVELQPSPCDYGDIQLSIAPRSAARTVYQPYRPPTPLRELEGWRIGSVRSYLSSRIAGENHIVRGAALEWFSNSSRGPTLFSNEQ